MIFLTASPFLSAVALLSLAQSITLAFTFHLESVPHKIISNKMALKSVADDINARAQDSHNNNDSTKRAMISTEQLLSTLIHAAAHGSQTILSLSDIARNGSNEIQFKEEGDARSALTVADTSAQRVIVSSILGSYPTLNIVGEEDESVEVSIEFQKKLRDDLLACSDWTTNNNNIDIDKGQDTTEPPPPPAELDMSKLIVFVDPLDGTREFVEGRLENVQTLIGVVYKGVPLMGAIGLPFSATENDDDGKTSSSSSSIEIVFGLVGKGIGKMKMCNKNENEIVMCPPPQLNQYHDGDTIYISTGDSSSVRPAVDLASKIFKSKGVGISHQLMGATGNKLLKVACCVGPSNPTTLSLLHTKTSLWDTAAPTALLVALGGKVTDYFGEPLVYNPEKLGNRLGVVASAPGAKCEHGIIVEAFCGDEAILSLREKQI